MAGGRGDVKPKCIIITGAPGSGKTTLAVELGRLLQMPLLSRDQIKEGYVNTFGRGHDQLPADTNRIVTELFFDIVCRYLAGSVSVVIEAAFQHRVWRPHLDRIAKQATMFIIICSADATLIAKRRRARDLADPLRAYYHGASLMAGDEASDVVPYIPPAYGAPTLQLSTDGDYQPDLATVVTLIGRLPS